MAGAASALRRRCVGVASALHCVGIALRRRCVAQRCVGDLGVASVTSATSATSAFLK